MELNQIDCRTNTREKERERQKPADSTLLLLKLAWYQRVFSIKRLVTHFRSHRTNPMNRTNWTRIPGSVHIRSCNMFSMPYFALSHTIHVFCFFFFQIMILVDWRQNADDQIAAWIEICAMHFHSVNCHCMVILNGNVVRMRNNFLQFVRGYERYSLLAKTGTLSVST